MPWISGLTSWLPTISLMLFRSRLQFRRARSGLQIRLKLSSVASTAGMLCVG